MTTWIQKVLMSKQTGIRCKSNMSEILTNFYVSVSKCYDYKHIFGKLTNFMCVMTFCFIADIDECAVNNGNCTEFTDCRNFPGSYSCTCMTGFTGEGLNCSGTFVYIF